ncbi:hypothetical protein [Actinomyces wuliandei]|uniref:hypothetical protein n=1 Tax=Actinomyces wuliandei TaxID=2057743 RepID=UPI000FDC83A5|nr:hypothetical protein [Actinomyces wuliandei]
MVSKTPFLPQPPQWKFFAPNPGVENYYVFYRFRSKEDAESAGAGAWRVFPMTRQSKWYSFLWNSGSRRGKALFDVVQQVRILAGHSGSYEWAKRSQAFIILEKIIEKHIGAIRKSERPEEAGREGPSHYQFMIMGSLPAAGEDGFKPIAVSPWIEIS